MPSLDQLDQPPVVPIYRTDEPNSPILFESINISIPSGTGHRSVYAQPQLQFLPEDSLEFIVPSGDDNAERSSLGPSKPDVELGQEFSMKIWTFGSSIDAFLDSWNSDRGIYSTCRSPVQMRPSTDQIRRAVFHLFNWPKFSGADDFVLTTGVPPLQGWVRCGRIRLNFDGWEVNITATGKTSDLVDKLRETGGLTQARFVVLIGVFPYR